MTEEKEQKNNTTSETNAKPGKEAGAIADKDKATMVKPTYFEKKKNFKRGGRNRTDEKTEEFEQRLVDIARVTRVMAGGKRMRFRACVAIGNKKGRVAIALAKGADVTMAVNKAVNRAKKNFIDVPIVKDTIPHEIYQKYGAARILFKPARQGSGIIAGGAVRIILDLAGVKDITSKIFGTANKVNNVKCTIEALKKLKKVEIKKDDPKTAGQKFEKKIDNSEKISDTKI